MGHEHGLRADYQRRGHHARHTVDDKRDGAGVCDRYQLEQTTTLRRLVFWTELRLSGTLTVVDTRDQARNRLEREQRIRQRLQVAAERLNIAEWERTVAISAAHSQGLSVRQIAAAVHLSSARVHQMLRAPASATSKPTAAMWETGRIAPL
jgi:hypothetical protein